MSLKLEYTLKGAIFCLVLGSIALFLGIAAFIFSKSYLPLLYGFVYIIIGVVCFIYASVYFVKSRSITFKPTKGKDYYGQQIKNKS